MVLTVSFAYVINSSFSSLFFPSTFLLHVRTLTFPPYLCDLCLPMCELWPFLSICDLWSAPVWPLNSCACIWPLTCLIQMTGRLWCPAWLTLCHPPQNLDSPTSSGSSCQPRKTPGRKWRDSLRYCCPPGSQVSTNFPCTVYLSLLYFRIPEINFLALSLWQWNPVPLCPVY